MKKNFAKITTLILACLLLIGAAIGISVSAEDASVEIAYKNLAYEAAPRLVYYVDADNVAEGDTVKVLFFDSEPAEITVAGAAYVSESFGTLTVGETEYLSFASEEIAPKNLRLAVWAVPAIVNAEGNVVASGKAVKYSVYDYALDRFNMAPTPDQTALYTALLDFGGAVQEVLYAQGTYTEEDLQKAGGFANAYCGVRQDVLYDGKIVETGDVTYYKKGETVTLTAETSYNSYGIFRGFLDEAGELVAEGAYKKATVLASKPGVAVYQSEYNITGTIFNTYDSYLIDGSSNDVNVKYKGKKDDTLKNAIGVYSVNTTTFGKLNTDASYARLDKAYDDETNQVFAVGANTTAGGNSYAWTLDSVAVDADKYVFQTDFRWNGAKASTEKGNVYFRVDSTNITDDKCDIILFGLNDNGPDYSYYTILGKELNKGQWYTMRLEIIPLSATHYDYVLYFDGVAAVSNTNQTPTKSAPTAQNEVNKFIGFRMFNRKATEYSMEYDNTYVGIERDEERANYRGTGTYYNDETYAGTRYSYDGLEGITENDVLFSADDNAKKNISCFDDSFRYYKEGNPGSGFGIKYDGEKTSGNTYVFETDVYFGGGKATTGSDQIAWFGLTGADGRSKDNQFLPLAFYYKAIDGNITSIVLRDYVYGSLTTISLNEWHNIKFVYTVNNTLNEDGTVAEGGYGGNVEVYLDGVLVKSYATRGYSSNNKVLPGTASNEKITNIGFEIRGAVSGVTELDFRFDNTYIGALDVTPPVQEETPEDGTVTE